MKNKIIATVIMTATVAAVYLLIKRFTAKKQNNEPIKKKHHLTQAFAKAKEYAGNS